MDEQELKDVQTPQMDKKTRKCTRLFSELMKTFKIEEIQEMLKVKTLHERATVWQAQQIANSK